MITFRAEQTGATLSMRGPVEVCHNMDTGVRTLLVQKTHVRVTVQHEWVPISAGQGLNVIQVLEDAPTQQGVSHQADALTASYPDSSKRMVEIGSAGARFR